MLIAIAVGSASETRWYYLPAPNKIEDEIAMNSFVSPFAALDPTVFEGTNSHHEHREVRPTGCGIEVSRL